MDDVTLVTAPNERELTSLSVVTAIVVLATVTMMFGALILVFLTRSEIGLNWQHISVPRVLWATTVALVTSSFTFAAARRQLKKNDQRKFFRLMMWTTGLGVFFLAGQALAAFQFLSQGALGGADTHSSFIFLFLALHGAHILLGLSGLIYLLARTHEPASGPKYQMKTRAIVRGVSIFWHYLDFLWILLFVLLLIRRR